jgi:ABC-type phosphate transport system substrate-binding protein
LTTPAQPFVNLALLPEIKSEVSAMKGRSATFMFAFLCVCLTPCFAHHTAVVVNKENAVDNVTSVHLGKIIRGEIKKWPDGKNIVLVLHKDSAGENETLERLNKMSAAEWKAFLAAHRDGIVFVDTDADVLRTVQSEPGALGLIEVHSIDNSVNVIHVDGKLPMEFGYLPH